MNLNEVIGGRLKSMRLERNWSLDQTSKATGVSKPMLSQIERGESNPTVSTLWKIANGLGVSFSSFLEEKQPEVKLVSTKEVEPIADVEGKFFVRPIFPIEPGKPFEMYSVELLPGCHYSSEPHAQGVEEYIVVDKGEISLTIHQDVYQLVTGDNIRFAANYQHVYANRHSDPARITMMIYYS